MIKKTYLTLRDLRRWIDRAKDAILVVNPSTGRIRAVNEKAYKGFGLQKEELVGKDIRACMAWEHDKKEMADELISTVSHELRTPLAIIKGATSNLHDGILGPLSKKQAEVVDAVMSNINRLARLINDLLNISRLESGDAKIHQEAVNAYDLIADILTGYKAEAMQRGLQIENRVSPDLPPVYADSSMFGQVIFNLMNNAVKYAKGRIIVSADSTSVDRHPFSLQLTIEDDGPGISPENREKIFNKFEQINRQAHGPGYKGTGLGLSICKKIIGLHGGKIWVDTGACGGSRFNLTLPLYVKDTHLIQWLTPLVDRSRKGNGHLVLVLVTLRNEDEFKRSGISAVVMMLRDRLVEGLQGTVIRGDDPVLKLNHNGFALALSGDKQNTCERILDRIRGRMSDIEFLELNREVTPVWDLGFAFFHKGPEDASQLLETAHKRIEKLRQIRLVERTA